VPGDVAPDERAEREHGEAGGACFGQSCANQLGGQSLALEARLDGSVDEGDQAGAATVLSVAGDLPSTRTSKRERSCTSTT